MWPFRKKKEPSNLSPSPWSCYAIRDSLKNSWMVKARSIDHAMLVWINSLNDNMRLGERVFLIKVGDPAENEWVWETTKVLNFFKYALDEKQGE